MIVGPVLPPFAAKRMLPLLARTVRGLSTITLVRREREAIDALLAEEDSVAVDLECGRSLTALKMFEAA